MATYTMRLSRKSEFLLYYFYKKKLENIKKSVKTSQILKIIHTDLGYAQNYVDNILQNMNGYKLSINKIETVAQIPHPEIFTSDSFPSDVREYINKNMTYSIVYEFSLFGRVIKFKFIVEDNNPELKIESYTHYVRNMLVWMDILDEYSSKKCAQEITIFLYFTELFKELPKSNIEVLDWNHVNTAFTTNCPKISEIVVYRKEEWFKVFMHETFHNFALDFSDMNNNECHAFIRELFPVNSEVNLFEAYTECWAEIMNVCFYAFHTTSSINEYLEHCYIMLNIERKMGFLQLAKALNFMGLDYGLIHSNISKDSQEIRNTLYKEKTNVLSYYVIKMILFNNFTGFLEWCNKNNTSLFQFKKTAQNQREFCNFIEENSESDSFLDGVEWGEKLLMKLKQSSRKKNTEENKFLVKNMRMSIIEII
jgi:hypothetical protein